MSGAVAVYLANTFLNAAQKQNEESQLTRVAVAAVALPYGTEVTPEKIRFANYPKSSLPPAMGGREANGIVRFTLPFCRLIFSKSETE